VPDLNCSIPLLRSSCGGQSSIVSGFMEAQVNLHGGSRWSAEDPFIKYRSPLLTVESDTVVEKVRTQIFLFCYHHRHHHDPLCCYIY
jgi:hypothetical protein